MSQLRTLKIARAPRLSYTLCSRVPRHPYSSGSPSASAVPDDYFIKTGQREASDPCLINMRSDENSKSGGDDMVAEQVIASFKSRYTTDPAYEREIAGRGNIINPLDYSPASPEISKVLNEEFVERGVDRDPTMKTGYGISKKAHKIVKNNIDFRTK